MAKFNHVGLAELIIKSRFPTFLKAYAVFHDVLIDHRSSFRQINSVETKLGSEFFLQDTIEVARQLLGKKLVHVLPNGKRIAGFISETEAYLGIEDPAAHSFGDRRTNRTETMYAQGGIAYVYFIYGMYNCLNVVTRPAGEPEAVLVRGLIPTEGIDIMRQLRPLAKSDSYLANGPGKLCQALKLTREHNGLDLRGSRLYLTDGKSIADELIEDLPRVGIDYAGDAIHWPLRFRIQS